MSSSTEAIQAGPAIQAEPVRWPWVALAIFFATALTSMVFVVLNHETLAAQIPYVIAFSMFGVVGALIVSRDRRNTIGLLFIWSAFVASSSFLSGEILTYAVVHGRDSWWVVACGLVNGTGWLFGILLTVFLLPLLFPDGRLPSRRWRPLLWLIAVFVTVIAVSLIFGQKTLTGSGSVEIANPAYVDAVGSLPNLDPVIGIMFPGIFAASIVSLVLRFRRSTGVERQQIKWVVFGFAVALVAIVGSSSSNQDTVLGAFIGGTAFLLFPLSVGIAILRFRLYDLDVVVRKAVVYAALALFATVVYIGLVVGLGAWFGRGDSFLTMVAAVIVAVTFQPVRGVLTRFANRLVYGKRATPYEVLSEFSERVGGAYAEEDVLPRMVRVLGEGIGAERADVWLAVDHELRDVAAWPADVASRPPMPLPNGSIPQIDGMDRVYPVEQAGELLGALAVRKPSSDPVSPADEKLIADLASQAGLVLRNVRLSEALKARLDELKAAQKRLVSAQDAERRRLERNIHDGAQQQLVALAVKLKLADGLIERDAGKARELVGQLQGETHAALEDLRDLARGIYPPLLADKGLPAALEAQARKSDLPIEVRADGIGRYPQDIEAAVYFSCLEAMQNIAKYASASSVSVSLSERDHSLTFAVTDDGRGFDRGVTTAGTGLQGIADRVGALDGQVTVTSAPGRGTTIEGRLPVPVGAGSRA
ncbi:MAG: histidine kinase [Actinomycetota bacterium]